MLAGVLDLRDSEVGAGGSLEGRHCATIPVYIRKLRFPGLRAFFLKLHMKREAVHVAEFTVEPWSKIDRKFDSNLRRRIEDRVTEH
jgi:hypothetical protein